MRVAFAGMFSVADREGRFRWKPSEHKLDILPYDLHIDFSRVMEALASTGFIVKYEHAGKEYGCIPTFKSHQVINNKESASVLPSQTDEKSKLIEIVYEFDACSTRDDRVTIACPTPLFLDQGEGKGREGKRKGREGEVARVHASKDIVVANAPTRNNPSLELVDHWKAEFQKTYNEKPLVPPKEWGSAKNILKTVSLDLAKELVTSFFEMREAWFRTKRHSLSTLLDNLNAVKVYQGTGAQLNRITEAQQEKTDAAIEQLKRIDRGAV